MAFETNCSILNSFNRNFKIISSQAGNRGALKNGSWGLVVPVRQTADEPTPGSGLGLFSTEKTATGMETNG
jgi:hypothetical protein